MEKDFKNFYLKFTEKNDPNEIFEDITKKFF